MSDFANAWQAADKVVYSTTVAAASTANTQLERRFDPSAVRDLKAAASWDLLVGGPNLAAQALVAGLVDELALFSGQSSSVGAAPHWQPIRAPI
jgi:riboflavin biosynthesis pyrimidine reductase